MGLLVHIRKLGIVILSEAKNLQSTLQLEILLRPAVSGTPQNDNQEADLNMETSWSGGLLVNDAVLPGAFMSKKP